MPYHGRLSDGTALTLTGGPLDKARFALILVHGRGASAEGMAALFDHLDPDPSFVGIAPQAPDHTWYPHSFLAHSEQNQPFLDESLSRVANLVSYLRDHGIPPERTALLGFSQGACLVLEFVARNAHRYGGVIGLIGGLIGPPGASFDYDGSFAGTPVFLGAPDPDPHVPFARVEETAHTYRVMGAEVELKKYPGAPHSINEDQLMTGRRLLNRLAVDTNSP